MSTNIPIIAVSADSQRHHCYEHHSTSASFDSDDNSSNDMDYNQNIGGLTDVEDLDTYAGQCDSRRSSRNSLVIPNMEPNTQGVVTDIEDYDDSEANEQGDKSNVYPDFKLSLEEFLQHNVQDHLSISNGARETVQRKTGNFLQAQNLNTLNDYLTDCEDFSTDSEIENNCEKSVCVDLKKVIVEPSNVNIVDSTANDNKSFDCNDDDVSVVSEISDMTSALTDATGRELQGMSEDEYVELSSNPEICQISCSDSDSISTAGNISEEGLLSSASIPPIDVTFIYATNMSSAENNLFYDGNVMKGGMRKNLFLKVEESCKQEVLTDTERFDDSVAESGDDDSFDSDDGNQQPIPRAVIFPVDDDVGCITDCEDLFYDDVSEAAVSRQLSALSVDLTAIPPPQREVIMLQEDKFGDTIASVMPMDTEYHFGIYALQKDECLTDTEEYSCTDDFDMHSANLYSRSLSPSPHNVLVESDVTISNEILKTQQSKRLEIISNAESVTDVEEIYMDGTNNRKKKIKSRAINKSKPKLLETLKPKTKDDSGGADIEDIDRSESGLLTSFKYTLKGDTNRDFIPAHSEKVTDVEDITVDDVSFVSKAELPVFDTNATNLQDYDANSKNIVLSLETCGPMPSSKINKNKYCTSSALFNDSYLATSENYLQQQQTDIEDVQLPSDTEEFMNRNVVVQSGSQEFDEILSESCTTVHDKCTNSFNIDAEKLHIKNMLREPHTDTEYVESDESTARSSK